MKGDRLHIHLAHLEEAKLTEMPVAAHWRTQDYSQVQLRDTHTLPSSPSLALYTLVFFSSCLACHLQLCVFYRWPSSPWSWRVSACTVFVSYRQSTFLIRPLLYASYFSFFPLSIVGMLLFFHSCP